MLKKRFAYTVLSVMLASPAWAGVYYVSPAGNDGNPGTLAQPWRNLNSAVTRLAPGDILNIRAGTYNEWLDNNVPGGTSWTTPVTVKAYNNEAVTVRPSSGADFVLNFRSPGQQYIIVDGLDLDGVNTSSAVAKITAGAHHVRLIRCTVRNSPDGHGVLISSGDINYDTYSEVINCVIYNNGVTAYGGGTMNHGVYISTRHNLVDGCLIFGNQDHAIHNFSGDASYNVYRNNRIYGNPSGIGIYSGNDNYIYNNIAYSNGIAFRAGYGSTSTSFINNTAYKNVLNYQVQGNITGSVVLENNIAAFGTGTIDPSGFHLTPGASSKGVIVRNNLSFANAVGNFSDGDGQATLANNLFGNTYNAQFVDAVATNFTILIGSSARNTGRAQTAFSSDITGAARPQEGAWDIGAHEYSTGTPANTPPLISSVSDQTIVAGTATLPIAFTVSDAETAAGSLTVSGSSSSLALVPNGNIVFGGSGSARTVVITPAVGQFGTATITITVSDGTSTANRSFVLTVTQPAASNTAPSVNAGADQAVTLPGAATLNGTVTDDGLPNPPGALTGGWSKVSGPGTVTFANANAAQTTATFSIDGTYVLRLSANDSALTSSDDMVVTVAPAGSTGGVVTLPIEAESGSISSPMAVYTEPQSQQAGLPSVPAQYVSSSITDQGTATYSVNIPTSGNYVIWCRVLTPTSNNDSFYASVDGAEVPYIASEGTPSASWKWTRVNQRVPGPTFAVAPRIFSFTPGNHTIMFRGRETDTCLDRLLVTNDMNLVPLDTTGQTDAPRIVSSTSTEYGMLIAWTTIPGRTYRVVYKTNVTDPQWTPLSGDMTATGSSLYWADGSAGSSAQRFYSISLLP